MKHTVCPLVALPCCGGADGALADTFFADRRTRLVTRVLFVVLSCLVLGGFAFVMDVIIWLNVWVRQSEGMRVAGAMLSLVSWR